MIDAAEQSKAGTEKPTRGAPPGPKDSWPFGTLRRMAKDPLGLLMSMAQTYGDVVSLRLTEKMLFVNHPDHVKHLLQDNHLNYLKGQSYQRLESVVGKGLLTSEGEFWKRQRRLAQPAFHRQRVAGFASLMVRSTEAMLERWKAGNETAFDIHHEMMKLTLTVVGEALFSIDLLASADRVGKATSDAVEILNEHTVSLFVPPLWMPTPLNLRLRHALKVLNELVDGIISERRKRTEEHGDLLGMFMAVKDADTGESMTDRQLRDEVMTMVLAGHETSANVLTFTLYLLSLHPMTERAVRAELAEVLNGRLPGFDDLPRLTLLTCVIQEAMRLYPPAWFIGRKAIAEDCIDGYTVPAGSTVLMIPYVLHRDARFWDHPEAFDPDRFSPARSEGRPRLAYFPFAAGPRMCIGNAFAMMEVQLILAVMLQKVNLELPGGYRLKLDPQITLRPAGGMPMRCRPLP